MAHKTLIGGTAYNIVGGKSLVSGTAYNIKKGGTRVNGTGYNINFIPEATAMLYSTGDFVFQRGDEVESGKTLVNSYTGFEDRSYSSVGAVPWNAQRANIKNVYCNEEIAPSSMGYWFNNCVNLVKFNIANFNINNVTNMCYTYHRCTNLTGSPVCGDKVTNMYCAYRNCYNLTGSPACGDNVTGMTYTYQNCRNLTGSPVCGDKVTNMGWTYANCYNLTGSPVCGDKVTSMGSTYQNCRNLTGFPVCGNNVTNMGSTYKNCTNLAGNAYFYSSTVSNTHNCFYGKNNSRYLNIYIPSGSTTETTVLYNNTYSLVGANITWTNAGTYHYNTVYNIYIYPVANVAAARAANGD